MDKYHLPIDIFKNTADAVTSLKEWQTRLGLFDWTIKVKLCEPHQFTLEDCDGECEFILILKCAVIRILKPEYYGDRIMKYCAERILVHELLHCKLCILSTEDDGFNRLMHQIHEDLARALICAKYNLPLDWFSNITYEEDENKAI